MGWGNRALQNRLREAVNMEGAKGLLVNVTGGLEFTLNEYDEVMKIVSSKVDSSATVIPGNDIDENLKDAVKVTVIATGFGGSMSRDNVKKSDTGSAKNNDELSFGDWNNLIEGRGVSASMPPTKSPRSGADQISVSINEDEVDLLIPTVLREKRFGSGR